MVSAPSDVIVEPTCLLLSPIVGSTDRVATRGNNVSEPPDKSLDVVKDGIVSQDHKDPYSWSFCTTS